jgi:anion-transporting  ArsA/GET3 family ATPase
MRNEPAGTRLIDKRVVVVCGAGGVGKTTTSAALALAAARAGRSVLVLTIDPSRRLAQTLGVSAHAPEPTPLAADRQREAGIEAPGCLSAWMLDPQSVANQTVRRLVPDEASAARLLQNRIYRNVTSMVAGMQEYMAVEALHEFVRNERYDLIVLDTPPSRDALRFLDAPSRVTAFLEPRVLRLFVPGSRSRVRRAATRVFERLLDLAFGERTRREIQQFFERFEKVLLYLSRNQGEMRSFFGGDDVAFLLVSSPRTEALEEAFYFEEKAAAMELPLAGYVLNRSLAGRVGLPRPAAAQLGPDADEALRSGLAKLAVFADEEAARAARHGDLCAALAARTPGAFAVALPELREGASELGALAALSHVLASGTALAAPEPSDPDGVS